MYDQHNGMFPSGAMTEKDFYILTGSWYGQGEPPELTPQERVKMEKAKAYYANADENSEFDKFICKKMGVIDISSVSEFKNIGYN